MSPEFVLRPAAPEDEPFLRELFVAGRTAEFATLPLTADQKQSLLEMQYRARKQQYLVAFPEASYLLVVVDGAAVGSIAVCENGESVHAIDLAIAPAWQNLGLGTAVLRQLMDEAAKNGKPVQLQVALTNRARRLYERLGFEQTGEDGMYAQMTWTGRSSEAQAAEDRL